MNEHQLPRLNGGLNARHTHGMLKGFAVAS